MLESANVKDSPLKLGLMTNAAPRVVIAADDPDGAVIVSVQPVQELIVMPVPTMAVSLSDEEAPKVNCGVAIVIGTWLAIV